ncbi:hypothetical protein M5K25_026548 [Dendrobium thyrsiflorum]|uniref:Uncharacterized protein n=1 Tax=Dendrobium thyrsiflorum TaxID=117978 RepID=A0ABD0TY35_DENTH
MIYLEIEDWFCGGRRVHDRQRVCIRRRHRRPAIGSLDETSEAGFLTGVRLGLIDTEQEREEKKKWIFAGVVLMQIGNLSNPEMWSLFHNNLVGIIPIEIGKLYKLNLFYIYENQMSEAIPKELMNCSSLEELDLFGNHFSSHLPNVFGGLKNLITSLPFSLFLLVNNLPPNEILE